MWRITKFSKKNEILYYCFDFYEIWYLYVKLDDKTDSASIFAHIFSVSRENRDFLLKKMIVSDLDMFTQFEFESTIFEVKQIQIVI